MAPTGVVRLRRLLAAGPIAALIGVGLAVVPVTTVQALEVHKTKAHEVVGPLDRSQVRQMQFPASHVALYWTGHPDAKVTVAFSTNNVQFGQAFPVEHDEVGMQLNNNQTYGAVIPAGNATFARITSDQPLGRITLLAMADDGISVEKTPVPGKQVNADPVVNPRSAWGADESLRVKGTNLTWPPVFQTVQKIAVHHTAGANGETGLAAQATIRKIYYYHTVTLGYGDIGYQFLMDAAGVIYRGRSTSAVKLDDGNLTGENTARQSVTAGHASGHNSGVVGVAVMGNYVSTPVPSSADAALKDFLFTKTNAHGLHPAEINLYTNPTNGVQDLFENVPGHLEVPNNSTECPGGVFQTRLRDMRSELAAQMKSTPGAAPDKAAPNPPTTLTTKTARRAVTLTWTEVTVDSGSGGGTSGVVGYDVYRKSATTGALTYVASTTGVTYTDNAAARGLNTYVVKTFDGAANRSLESPVATAQV